MISIKLRGIAVGATGIDEDTARIKGKESLERLGGPMIRTRTKKAKEILQQVLTILFEFRPKL